MNARSLFLKKWFMRPISMGSLMPSSKYLCRKLVDMISISGDDQILLLGVGTGPVLHAFKEKNMFNVISIEKDNDLYEFVSAKYPEYQIIKGDACNIKTIFNDFKFKVIISALPITILDEQSSELIIENMMHLLMPNGRIFQYSYRFRSPIDVEKYPLKIERRKRIIMNIPPACISEYSKI